MTPPALFETGLDSACKRAKGQGWNDHETAESLAIRTRDATRRSMGNSEEILLLTLPENSRKMSSYFRATLLVSSGRWRNMTCRFARPEARFCWTTEDSIALRTSDSFRTSSRRTVPSPRSRSHVVFAECYPVDTAFALFSTRSSFLDH